MPLSAEQRRARARIAINQRWHPDKPELTEADAAELERARIDAHVAAIKAAGRKGTLTPDQEATLRRVFRYGPAPGSAA